MFCTSEHSMVTFVVLDGTLLNSLLQDVFITIARFFYQNKNYHCQDDPYKISENTVVTCLAE